MTRSAAIVLAVILAIPGLSAKTPGSRLRDIAGPIPAQITRHPRSRPEFRPHRRLRSPGRRSMRDRVNPNALGWPAQWMRAEAQGRALQCMAFPSSQENSPPRHADYGGSVCRRMIHRRFVRGEALRPPSRSSSPRRTSRIRLRCGTQLALRAILTPTIWRGPFRSGRPRRAMAAAFAMRGSARHRRSCAGQPPLTALRPQTTMRLGSRRRHSAA